MTKDEALKELLEIVEHAIIVGDWKVDGACDPEMIINACEEALKQPAQSEYMVNEGGTGTVLRKSAPSWQGLSDDEILVRKWKDAYKILE